MFWHLCCKQTHNTCPLLIYRVNPKLSAPGRNSYLLSFIWRSGLEEMKRPCQGWDFKKGKNKDKRGGGMKRRERKNEK